MEKSIQLELYEELMELYGSVYPEEEVTMRLRDNITTQLENMTKGQLEDIKGFIVFCRNNNMANSYMLSNIIHDLDELCAKGLDFCQEQTGM